jgi:hypothetical protein
MDDRQFRIVAILLGVVALLLLFLLVVLLFGGGEDQAAESTTTTQLGGSTSSTETTVAADTTTSSTTTSSSTSSSTTTTTTTSTTTTTTTIAPIVLEADGIGGSGFGATPQSAIGYVTAVLGPSTEDSGWVEAFSSPYGVCPAPDVRGVHWGSFVLLFTRAATDFAPAGTEHLFSYYYTDNVAPAIGLGTADNIFIGSTRAELEAAYGSRLEVFDDIFGVIWHVDRDPSTETSLSGYLSGPTAADLVEAINGGVGCGE